ncbi:MAG: ECF transporter S component [Chloroflexota bacterium]
MATMTPSSKPRSVGWKTQDLLVTAVISLVCGIVFIGLSYIYLLAISALTPAIAGALLGSVFILPGLLTTYIIRRPGVALTSQILAGLVQVLFDPTGWIQLVIYIVNGLLCELPFFITRYRNYSLPVFIAAGILVNLTFLVLGSIGFGLANIIPQVFVIAAILSIGTGILVAWLARLFGNAIAQTGVLSRYAVGQQQEEI